MQQNTLESAPQQNDISIREYFDLLRRRKTIFLQTFVVVLAVGAVITLMSRARFVSSTRILVEGRTMTMAQYNTGDPLSNLFMPDVGHDVPTQTEVLQAEKVLAEAYHAADVPPDSAHIDVKQVNATDVIEVFVEASSPTYAERLAKALPVTYLKYITGNRKTEVTNALVYAQDKLKEERAKLELARLRLQSFKKQQRVASLDTERNQSITDAANAAADLKKSETEVAGAKARLAELVAAQRDEPRYLDNDTSSTNLQIDSIKNQIAMLETEKSRALVLYPPDSVEVQKFDAQINTLKTRLSKMPPTVTIVTHSPNPDQRAYNSKIAEARATVASLESGLVDLRTRATQTAQKLQQYSSLERQQADFQAEVDQRQATVNQLSKSVMDLSLREKAIHDPIQSISGPTRAEQIAPKKLQYMIYAGAIALVVGFCFALMQELMDDRIHSQEDARRILGVPVLGYVPLVEREDARLLARTRSGGALLESYRLLRSNVQFAMVDTPASSILITSSVSGEGKSTTAANLAVAMALDGRRVILVDADMRRPTQHEKLGVESTPGLSNVMLGQLSLDEALQDTSIPGLRLLAAGSLPPNPAELLHSHTMRHVHDELKARADIVIFDSPPCLGTADAQVLSADVDGVIYVVQFGEARKHAVHQAGDLLSQARARVLGVVFNKIEAGNRHDPYYGYHGYYTSSATTILTHRLPAAENGKRNGKEPHGEDSHSADEEKQEVR